MGEEEKVKGDVMNKEKLFEKLADITSDLRHTIKMFEKAGGASVDQKTILFKDEFTDLRSRFDKAIKDYLGPSI